MLLKIVKLSLTRLCLQCTLMYFGTDTTTQSISFVVWHCFSLKIHKSQVQIFNNIILLYENGLQVKIQPD